MCWNSNSEKYIKPKVLKVNKTVYKIGTYHKDEMFIPFFRMYTYYKNELQKKVKLKVKKKSIEVEAQKYYIIEGYHSFIGKGVKDDYYRKI